MHKSSKVGTYVGVHRDSDECYDNYVTDFLRDEEAEKAIKGLYKRGLDCEVAQIVFTKMALEFYRHHGDDPAEGAKAAREAAVWFDGLAKSYERLAMESWRKALKAKASRSVEVRHD